YGVPSDNCLEALAAQGGIVSATSKPGSVIVFDCNVMHGSNGNITPFPRSNVFFVYNAIGNKVIPPFCNQAPRPEHICSRDNIHLIPRTNERDRHA
ncbi:MAG TPA: ectoine hydroxylase, partial [Methylococcaceae bacterium]|nr:ectoine hydroxylase [Methylococcaceae bacterium]